MAGRKSIKDTGADAFSELMGGNDVTGAQGMQVTDYAQPKALRTERLYFKVTPEVKEYLRRAAWENSTMTRRVSMTDYVSDLVEADMGRHPEWRPVDIEQEGE